MTLAAELPPIVAAAPADRPGEAVVVSRDTRSEVLFSKDTPLPLIKGSRSEDALLRQAVFVTSTLTVVRPAQAGEDILRWTFQPYLQRELCFTSMTGQFSCTAAEVTALPEKHSGEAPMSPPEADGGAAQTNPAAEAARAAVAASLRARGPALFGEDRRLKIEPMLKAAGVSVRTASGGGRR